MGKKSPGGRQIMTEGKLAKWVKDGYPYVKEEGGLAPWVLPEHGYNRIVDEAGDDVILKLARPLGLADTVPRLSESAIDPASVSPQDWQDAVRKWQYLSQLQPVIAAFMEVASPVMGQLVCIKPAIDPAVTCRNVAVLLLAPFVEQGKAIMAEMAEILGKINSPAELILGYGEAVSKRDVTTLEKVDRCIVKYGSWQEWASGMQQEVLGCRHTPKLVAVTPPASPDLVGVLKTLIEEVQNGYGGDHPESPGKPVIAH
jgi:hypothetical protein